MMGQRWTSGGLWAGLVALGCVSARAEEAPRAVYALARDHGAPVALKDIGMREQDLDRACALAMENPYPNPRPLEAQALRQLLQDAFEGVPPGR